MAEQLSEATLGGVKLRLATWLDPAERFTDRHIPVRPTLQYLPNEPSSLVARRFTPYWKIDDWGAGEGYDTWEPDIPGFNKSESVTTKRVGRGLVLGPFVASTNKTGAVAMDEGGVLGYGDGSIFSIAASNHLHKWNKDTEIWEEYNTVAAPASQPTSIADPGDGWIYVGYADGTIRRYNGVSTAQTHYTGFTNAPVLTVYGDKLYALDGDDLYDIDKVATNTRTLVADIIGVSNEYLGETPHAYRRLGRDAIGPIWLQRLNSGLTIIWRYNVDEDFYEAVGELPVQMALPTSIFAALGFIFVGFRVAGQDNDPGNGHIYFQRGGQRGVTDPIRATTTANRTVTIAGLDGNDLLFTFNDQVWAYNISDGGVFHLGPTLENGGGGNPWALTLGGSLFASPVAFNGGATLGCLRADRLRYTTTAARTLDGGMWDTNFFDIPKRMLEVDVITEPLPAGTSIGLAYAIDGDSSFTTVTAPASASTTNAKKHQFRVSTVSGGTVIGRRFELRLILTSTDEDATPTIRSWTARFHSAAHEREITMVIDFGTDDDGSHRTDKIISDLKALIAAQTLVNLVLPWQKRDGSDPETVEVQIDEVSFPDSIQEHGQLVGVVRCYARDLVEA